MTLQGNESSRAKKKINTTRPGDKDRVIVKPRKQSITRTTASTIKNPASTKGGYSNPTDNQPEKFREVLDRVQNVLSVYKQKEKAWKKKEIELNNKISFLLEELMKAKK